MLNKVFNWTSSIVQVLFLIAAYGIQYFSMKRMGMMRYVVFKNHEWEAQFNVTAIRLTTVFLLLILCVIVILYLRTKNYSQNIGKKDLAMIIVDITITLIAVLFILLFTTQSYRSYYFTSLILAIIVLIQHIKILIASVLR